MAPAVVAALIGLAGQLYSGYKSSQAQKEANAQNEKTRQMYQNWYDREYYADPLQRSDAQRLLNRTQEMIRERNRHAAGTQAVQGGTEESLAATKEANAKAMADAVGQVAALNETRKDNINSTYMGAMKGYYDNVANQETARANNIAAAGKGVADAAAKIAGGGDWSGGSTDSPTTSQQKQNDTSAAGGRLVDPYDNYTSEDWIDFRG